MWLLSTARAELCFFPTVEHARQAGYAILSHVWDETEQSFQETEALRVKCSEAGLNPRNYSSPKVRASCILAERHGFSWIWNDTCCIDKTSSAGLSEAINAMFTYYARAAVCYAYLRDVRRKQVVDASGAWNTNDITFDRSQWFTRGWTLQELIAPEEVVFLSQEWEVIGTKADLASLIAWITGIPAPVLRLERQIWDASIAQRMSWAAHRQTTRPEDEAYCLMGLFRVNMPVLYGEGRNAFVRLQEEIMRISVDATLFAWGDVARMEEYAHFKLRQGNVGESMSVDDPRIYMFAPSPGHYSSAYNVSFAPDRARDILDQIAQADMDVSASIIPRLQSRIYNVLLQDSPAITHAAASSSRHSTFTVTPYGVLAHLPVLELMSHNNVPVKVAILPVVFEYAQRYSVLGLPLSHWHARVKDSQHSLGLPLYFPGSLRLNSAPGRLWGLSTDTLPDYPIPYRWQDIYLAHLPPPPQPVSRQLNDRRISAPFRLKQTLVDDLERKGFRVTLPTHLERPWDDDLPVSLAIHGVKDPTINFAVHLGRCEMCAIPGTGDHWAYVTELKAGAVPYDGHRIDDHDCLDDHIPAWDETRTRLFEFSDSGLSMVQIRLTFALWALSSSTYVLDIDVERRYVLSVAALNQERYARADELDSIQFSDSDRHSDDASIWVWSEHDDSLSPAEFQVRSSRIFTSL